MIMPIVKHRVYEFHLDAVSDDEFCLNSTCDDDYFAHILHQMVSVYMKCCRAF